MSKYFHLIVLLFAVNLSLSSQTGDVEIEKLLNNYFNQYKCETNIKQPTLQKLNIDHRKKKIEIYASESFAYQPFTSTITEEIYKQIRQILPRQISSYQISVFSGNKEIEELIPNLYRSKKKDKNRLFDKNMYASVTPWVSNTSKSYEADMGLPQRHLAVCPSHGIRYNNNTGKWDWQRPNLFCTNEDIFTQSFMLPYIIPMLENAGAYIFTPRERDIQTNEVIVDNDLSNGSLYIDEGNRKRKWKTSSEKGFGLNKSYLNDGENPFNMGSARVIATEKKSDKAFAEWIPSIPETGEYAVYVSYQSYPNSVTDAKYLVFHKGGITEFSVNQQIGGGTWVYLGTFEFDKGRSATGMVILTNQSKEKGMVSADAVRFGGGKGNIVRGGTVSGKARFLEGARYSAQWAGMPYTVYASRKGENDYAEDINVRSLMVNYLAGGSVFNPNQNGLGVPLEMYLSLHTDAGHSREDNIIGSLGIYTTDFNNGQLNAGTDRYTSRDLSDILLTQLKSDLQNTYQSSWTRRSLRDANYSETRMPGVASTIIELLSHQNFADMKWGHDPNFKFTASRAIYKGILKYISQQHSRPYVVQPLPVTNFSIQFGEKKNTLELGWIGQEDPLEPTASPKEYVVYTRMGNGGFDNGTLVKSPHHSLKIEPGIIYSFKVAAVNRGGESFPSEILAAYKAPNETDKVLIVNAFDRISGPAVINTANSAGFDLNRDPGVPYLYNTSFTGAQQVFDRRQGGKEGKGSLGYGEEELVGVKIAGNTFDYPYIHGKAIQASGNYSFTSSSDEAVENGLIQLIDYDVVDLILGLEKEDPNNSRYYKSFSPKLQDKIRQYCDRGGNILISGSFIGSDMNNSQGDRSFIQNVLKYQYQTSLVQTDTKGVSGLGDAFYLSQLPNASYYPLTAPESLTPVNGSFTSLVYNANNSSAAVGYKGNYRTYIMGFPFENISSERDRARVMASILHFFQIK